MKITIINETAWKMSKYLKDNQIAYGYIYHERGVFK